MLQINSIDVRNATHDRCIQLMTASGDKLTLKVTKPAGPVGALPRVTAAVPGYMSFLSSEQYFSCKKNTAYN